MIEYPEAFTLARQIDKELSGKKVASCTRGNSPHKFAMYNREPGEFEKQFTGATFQKSYNHHCLIFTQLDNGLIFVLGEGGEKILLHNDKSTIPKKHQLLLGFDDGRYLSVSISGWGFVSLYAKEEIEKNAFLSRKRLDPLVKDFTLENFKALFEAEPKNPSIKYFLVSEPGISGVGNGMCQEILFEAKLHSKTKVKSMSGEDILNLHKATEKVVSCACELGGRDTETDIFGNPGGYNAIMNAKNLGAPCPNCGTPIERIAWLGGNCYFCPSCQKIK